MSILKFTAFGGEVPRLTKRNLPDNAAQTAQNLLADTMEFRPLQQDVGGVPIGQMLVGETCKTLYRYPSNSVDPFGSHVALKLEKSPIVDDQYDRVYVSSIKGEGEYAPAVLLAGTNASTPDLKRLGVHYPTTTLTLGFLTGESYLTPAAVEDAKDTILGKLKAIITVAVEPYWWNPAMDASPLTAARGFRASPFATTDWEGTWQRVFGIYAASAQSDGQVGTWVTFNNSPLERHMWLTDIQSPPHFHYGDINWMDGRGTTTRAYYFDFPGRVQLWRVKSDTDLNYVSTNTAVTPHGARQRLAELVIDGTNTRVLSDDEITGLFAALRARLPNNAADNPSTDAQGMLASFTSAYSSLVPILENGSETDETPAMVLQKVLALKGELQSAEMGIRQAFESFATTGLDTAFAAYMQETRFDGKFPEGENPLIELRSYTYTFVNSRGEESKPYLPGVGNEDTEFELFTVNQKQGVEVTRPAVSNDIITAQSLATWRIYRIANGSEASSMLYVGELPIATTVFQDYVKTEQLNEVLATTSWYPPPVAGPNARKVQNFEATELEEVGHRYLKGLVNMPGGFMAGYLDNSVYFSEVYSAYAWPPEYAVPCDDDIQALGVFGNTLVVLTNGRVSYISGASPDATQKIDIETVESCASARSVVPVSGGVIFASHNGLCLASQQGVRNLTSELFTRAEWLALNPFAMICEELDGVVYATHGAQLMMGLHVPSGKLSRIDTTVTAMYSDHKNGRLFVAYPPAPGEVAKAYMWLEQAGVYRTALWKSKRIVLEKETGFAWLAVEGTQSTAAPLNVNIWGFMVNEAGTEVQVKLMAATGTATYSAVVTDTRPMRVETGQFKDFEVEIMGTCRVSSVLLAPSSEELKGVN